MKIRMPGHGISVPNAGGRIGQALSQGRWYEQEMLEYITSLGLDCAYIDVGANIGNHSVYFATNTQAQHVFAFEPVPVATEIFRTFIDINNLSDKVTLLPFACHETNGNVEVRPDYRSEKTVSLAARRLDDVITSKVDLIKMDIEGAEPSALRGALRILREHSPVLFIESVEPLHMAEIMGVIAPIGYRATGKVFNASPTYEFRRQVARRGLADRLRDFIRH